MLSGVFCFAVWMVCLLIVAFYFKHLLGLRLLRLFILWVTMILLLPFKLCFGLVGVGFGAVDFGFEW